MKRNVVVELHKTTKIYRLGEVQVKALEVEELKIFQGEFVAILGPSGSGKTTLLNLVGALDQPTSGKVFIEETDISRFNAKQLTRLRREKIGFIFQFFNLIPTLTARENVEFALELTARSKPIKRDALTLLEMVGLKERANHFPYQLSGGEQQRVAVARSLAKDPVIILGDEPTGSLDYRMGKLVLQALKMLNEKEGKTVVIVTHNIPISRMADRILHLRDGQIAKEEVNKLPLSPEEIIW